jgi:hypothetical protein
MHDKTCFWIIMFLKNTIWFFFWLWETWLYARNKKNLFFMKTEYFNTRFVSLRYKNKDRYLSKWLRKKITDFSKWFLNIFFLGWAHSFWAGPDPDQKRKNWAYQLQGWTQPSRVGWVDVPARQNKRAGYCAHHSNFLIKLHLRQNVNCSRSACKWRWTNKAAGEGESYLEWRRSKSWAGGGL